MLEQGQDIAQNTSLKLRFIRCPERPAQFEGDPEEARRTQAFRIFTHETNTRGCEPFLFEIMRGRTDGARTIRSDRHQKDSIDTVLLQQPGHFPCRRLDLMRQPTGTVDRVVIIGNLANLTVVFQFAQPIDWKDDVHVLLKAGPVVVHGTLCHYQLGGVDITRYHPISKIPQRKVLIVAAMQPR